MTDKQFSVLQYGDIITLSRGPNAGLFFKVIGIYRGNYPGVTGELLPSISGEPVILKGRKYLTKGNQKLHTPSVWKLVKLYDDDVKYFR